MAAVMGYFAVFADAVKQAIGALGPTLEIVIVVALALLVFIKIKKFILKLILIAIAVYLLLTFCGNFIPLPV